MPDLPRIVTTCAPLRLSFAGGGTDLPDFYTVEDGAVLSTTIDKFVYVTVKSHSELFGEQYRLSYYDSEHAGTLDDINNDIIRECVRLVPVDAPLYISTVGDLPASSGLGSSGAFAVSLLQALHIKRGDRVSLAQLAEEACHIEMNVLAHSSGKQDQYAAAFGGLNLFSFNRNGQVTIEPQHLAPEKIHCLLEHIMLFWTAQSRAARDILSKQKKSIPGKMDNLRKMKAHSRELMNLLADNSDFDPVAVGDILDETWRQKRDLTSAITNSKIDEWYARALDAGATGGKISGAGGGGFLMLIVPLEKRAGVSAALHDMPRVSVGFEDRVAGSTPFIFVRTDGTMAAPAGSPNRGCYFRRSVIFTLIFPR